MALEVDAQFLVRRDDDAQLWCEPDTVAATPAARETRNARRWIWPIAGALLLATIGGWWLADRGTAVDRSAADERFHALSRGKPSLLVVPAATPGYEAIADAVRERLAPRYRVASALSSELVLGLDGQAPGNVLRADATLSLEVDEIGGLAGLSAHLEYDGQRRQVWAEMVPTYDVAARAADMAARVVRAFDAATSAGPAVAYFPLAASQREVLHGEQQLDNGGNELAIRRAQARFQAALRQDSGYALAHAGLCRALLAEYWMADEERAIGDAAIPCGQAIQLGAGKPRVDAAHAHFLQLTGRGEQAIALYERILSRHPRESLVLSGLAFASLLEFQKHGDAAVLQRGIDAAQHALRIDPLAWQPAQHLATLHLLARDTGSAVAAIEQGLARRETGMLLVNLGSMQTCMGNYDAAETAYERAQAAFPETYINDELLGQLRYFQGRFDESATLRKKAIDSFETGSPEVHAMWGNLGDSLQRTGDVDGAVGAYRKALEIVERDRLRGNATATDSAARVYYYGVLSILAPDAVRENVLEELSAELARIEAEQTEPSGLRYTALAYMKLGDREGARQALERATDHCPGYADYPDFAALSGIGRNGLRVPERGDDLP